MGIVDIELTLPFPVVAGAGAGAPGVEFWSCCFLYARGSKSMAAWDAMTARYAGIRDNPKQSDSVIDSRVQTERISRNGGVWCMVYSRWEGPSEGERKANHEGDNRPEATGTNKRQTTRSVTTVIQKRETDSEELEELRNWKK